VLRWVSMIAPVCLLAGTTTLFAQTPNNHIRTFGTPQGATATRPQSRPVPVYAVAGLRLGSRIRFDSSDYREYNCSPSEQFADFTWCQKTRQERDRRGFANVTYSILHSQDGTIVYVNRFQEPALFAPNEADAAIRRYSSNVGEKPQIKRLPPRPGFPAGMLATWGKVTLEPLDSESINTLAEGKSPKKGYLIDFIGNFTRSAKEGLPIYRMVGDGAGSVWAASFDQRGRGILRFAAIDPSALPATSLPNEPNSGDAEAKNLEGQPPPVQGAEMSPVKNPSGDAAAARHEDLPLQQAETTAEKPKVASEVGLKEFEGAKRDAQLAQAEVERLSAETTKLNAALEQSETKRASAEAKTHQMEMVAYGGSGILIALLAIVSSALLISRRKATAAKLNAITEANPSQQTTLALDDRNSKPLGATDTVLPSSELAHSPPADMSVGKDGDGSGISDMKSTPNSDTAEERVTLPT
jgi:hypothetical protein